MIKKEFPILLRALEPEDIDLIYLWENDKSIWQVSNTIAPFSRFILTKYLEGAHLDIFQTRQLRLMIDVLLKDGEKKTIGSIDLFDFEPFHLRAGVGILIGEVSERGKGFAQEALKELIEYAFTILQLNQLYCNIGADNLQSLAVFKNNGFKEIGLKKHWNKTPQGFSDEYFLQLIHPGISI